MAEEVHEVKEGRSSKKLSLLGEKLFKPFRSDQPSPNPKNELRTSLDRSDRGASPRPQSGGRSSKGNSPSFPPPLGHQASREELIKQLDDACEAARDPKPALEIVASTSPSASSHFESSPRKFSSGSTPQRVHSGSNPISVSPVVSSLISPRFDPQAATAVAEMASLSELQPLSSPGRNHHQHSTSAFSGLNVSLTSASGNSTIASAVPASVFGEPLRSSASDSVPGPVKHSRHHRSQSTTTSRRDEKKEKRDELTGAPSQITLSRREELLFELADQFQHRLEACMARLPLAPPTAISSPLASSAPLSPTSADRARAMSTTGFNTAAATPSASGSVDLLNRLTRIESSLTTIQKKISQYEQFFEHSFELQEHSNQKVIRLDSRVFYASCLMIAVIAILVVFIFR